MATTSRKPASKKTKTVRKSGASTSRKTTAKKVAPKKTTKVVSTVKITKAPVSVKPAPTDSIQKLRNLNLFAALVSAVQAGLILWLAKAFSGISAITTTFPAKDALASAKGEQVVVTSSRHLVDVHLSWLIAAMFIVSAIAHLSIATWLRRRYERELKVNTNRLRWITFSITASLTMLVIAYLAGVSDVSTLFAIVVFTVIAHMVGLSLEHYNQYGAKTRLGYAIGIGAAIAPAVIIAIYALGTHQYGNASTPMFVYWIYLSAVVMFAAFARNLKLSAKGQGRWKDYIYTERVYIWLALVSNALIAWQVYAGALRK